MQVERPTKQQLIKVGPGRNPAASPTIKRKSSPTKLYPRCLRARGVSGTISGQPNWLRPRDDLANWECLGEEPRFHESREKKK